jgi:hypothetical protein
MNWLDILTFSCLFIAIIARKYRAIIGDVAIYLQILFLILGLIGMLNMVANIYIHTRHI